MLLSQTLFFFSSLILLVTAQGDAVFKGLPGQGRSRTPTSTSKLMSRRDLNKRCTGTCAECFGAGYTLCPGSDIFCYLPGDATYGLDSCSSGSDGSDSGLTTSTASASAPTSTSTSGTDDLCYQVGATCVSCFGPGYLDCPDGYHCYNPSDPLYDTCPDDGSGSGGSDNSTTTASCSDLYGAGNVPCGTDSCYDPDDGESCCAGGYYCEAGYSCSSTLGKCSYGSGGSSGGSSSDTTTSNYNYATPTDGLVYSTPSSLATATTSGSSTLQTGVNQISDSSDARALVAARGLLIAAGVGALVL